MQIKQELRKELEIRRSVIEDKAEKDKQIFENLLALPEYKKAKALLCYVSFRSEINTVPIIKRALSDGKTVAVPHCENMQGKMSFYEINSLDELKAGAFGILEPDINFNKRLEVPENSIIIVPGLAFSRQGCRIGYGGGYYDRYLSENKAFSVGLCYDEMLCDSIPTEKHDVPVSAVVTDKQTLLFGGGENGF